MGALSLKPPQNRSSPAQNRFESKCSCTFPRAAHEQGPICMHMRLYGRNMPEEKVPAFLTSHRSFFSSKISDFFFLQNKCFHVPMQFRTSRFALEKCSPPLLLFNPTVYIYIRTRLNTNAYVYIYIYIYINVHSSCASAYTPHPPPFPLFPFSFFFNFCRVQEGGHFCPFYVLF